MLLFDIDPLWLSEEWLASAVSMGITYVVFIMGVPALVFQTFIPDALRSIYNKRFPIRWWPFIVQMSIIFAIFWVSIPHYREWIDKSSANKTVAHLILLGVAIILSLGWWYLLSKFKSSRNIEQSLSQKIARDAIKHYNNHGKLDEACLDDLRTMAKALPAGNAKNDFLAECENILEYLLTRLPIDKDTKVIGELLEESVCLSITYDGTQFNHENILKTLDILFLTYNQANSILIGQEDAKSTYLNTTIGSCMKEIGVKAMMKKDLAAVMDAVEKLSAIESTAREMFVLGDEAITHGHVTTAVTVIKKLSGKVPQNFTSSQTLNPEDRRNLFFWLGLMSKICLQKGSAGDFAQRQMRNVFKQFGENKTETEALLKNAQLHFYVLADFSTIDALKELELSLFPAEGKTKAP